MIIKTPTEVKNIIKLLTDAGYESYAVGGCVRDSIMGIVPHDWDICTSAEPQEVLTVLGKKNAVKNGEKHGTVTVVYNRIPYEITTFRSDGEYTDHRRPENVCFVHSLREDLARRDFTVNAIAYNDSIGICDYFDGAKDIERKIIRCVGDPDKRFNEDALRILRALRFSSRLGFTIDKKTSDSIHKNAPLLRNISSERIMSEFTQILMGKNTESVLLCYSDVIAVFIPEIKPMIGMEQHNPHHIYDVWTHTVKAAAAVKNERILRLSAFFHDIGKPHCATIDDRGIGHFKGHPSLGADMTRTILKRLKTDNKTIDSVIPLIEMHDDRPLPEPKLVRRSIAKLGKQLYPQLLELKKADAMAQNPDTLTDKLEYIEKLYIIYENEIQSGTAFSVRELKINGNDIMTLGITDGKKIGKILTQLQAMVIDGQLENDREELLDAVKNMEK